MTVDVGLRLKKRSLSRDYFWFVSAIALTVIALSIWFSWLVYHAQQKEMERKLLFESNRAERTLQESFGYFTHLATFLGSKIANTKAKDYNHIWSLLKDKSTMDSIADNLFSWTFFDWINAEGKLLVNTRHGVWQGDDWKDVSFRSYVKASREIPWVLHFSDPDIGIASGEWIIPAGVGVTDKKRHFLGTISAGFNIAKLSRKVEGSLGEEGIHFVILTQEGKVVLQSLKNGLDPKGKDFVPMVKGIDFINVPSGYLHKPLVLQGVEYSYYRQLKGYPFILVMGYSKDKINQYYTEVLLPRITSFVVIGSISLLLLFMLRQIIVKPIVLLSQAADKVAHGDLNVVVPQHGIYEIGNLAKQLENVVKYIEDLRQVSEELAKESEAAQSANRAKAGFLACMSHELRTPLNAVIAFSEILKEEMFGPLGNQKYKGYARDIFNSGRHLLAIINNILDLSKAEAGILTLQREEVDIASVIQQCLRTVSASAFKGKVTLSVDVSPALPHVLMDYLRLKQIITNLLSNAVKFTLVGGKVTIKAFAPYLDETKADVFITVEDTGIGMQPSDIPKAIKKFGQLDIGLNRKFEGTGLGLPLASKLVELHQGAMEIHSNLGKGTKVILMFPEQPIVRTKKKLLEVGKLDEQESILG